MRLAALFFAAMLPIPTLYAQQAASVAQELCAALLGDWTGVLEYRDYSEPPTSTKRVKLPTWLSVSASGSALRFRYTYDDGPGKTVVSTDTVTIDAARTLWTTLTEDKLGDRPHVDAVDGLDKLKSGRGILMLTGPGISRVDSRSSCGRRCASAATYSRCCASRGVPARSSAFATATRSCGRSRLRQNESHTLAAKALR